MNTQHITTTGTAPSESAEAADEFATWVRQNAPKLSARDSYEVRPCLRVRGFMLRLPGIGWRLWFPSVVEAMSFARRVAVIHEAECFVFDAEGERTA